MDGYDKHNLGDSLSLIIQEAGVMQKVHTDNAPKLVGRKNQFFKHVRKDGIDLTTIEPNILDENYSKIFIFKAKLEAYKILFLKRVLL